MVTKELPPPQVWLVNTRIPDEHEGDILSTTDDHFLVVATGRADLLHRGRQVGRPWLVRGDAQIRYPRADGSIGSLYPDILVAYDVQMAGYEPYDIQRVGKPPELLIEVLSDETARKDEDDVRGKLRAYAEMGVHEYLTFDPRPRKKLALHGYRLARIGQYEPIEPAPEGGFWLEGVGLRVVAEQADRAADRGPLLRWYASDGQSVPHPWEIEAAGERAARERDRALLQWRQAERERERERKARADAEAARQQAEAEHLRTQQALDAALAEVARLRARLGLPDGAPDASA